MEKIEYFVELKDGWLWWIFLVGWMDGCWRGVGGREITWYRVLRWMEYFFWKGEGMGSWLWFWMVPRVWSRDDFWLLMLVLLLLLLRVGIVRMIILMTIIIRVHDISYIVRSWGR